jgi:hypothetical protein
MAVRRRRALVLADSAAEGIGPMVMLVKPRIFEHLPEGGVEDRDALGQRDGQIEEQRALPGLLDGLGPEFAFALGGGVWLGGQQLSVEVTGFPAISRRPAQPGGFEPGQRVEREPYDLLFGERKAPDGTLAQGCDYRQPGARDRGQGTAALPMLIGWCMGVICRSLGFRFAGERDVTFAGRVLRSNHWVIDPAADLA